MGAAALPIALLIAGGGVSEYNNRKTANRQDNITAKGIIEQSKISDQAKSKIDNTLNFAESSSPEKYRESLQNDFLNSVLRARSSTDINQPGALSDAFRTGADAAGRESVDYAKTTGGLFARMDAPGLQRQAEGFQFGDNAADLAVLRRNSQQEEFLKLRVSRIRPNPWLNILASGLQGAATGVAANQNAPVKKSSYGPPV